MAPIEGEIQSLDGALRDFLTHYDPGQLPFGIQTCVITLPLPDWATFSYLVNDVTPSISAGSSDRVNMYRVRQDERAWLDAVRVVRVSGDNNIADVGVTFPARYFEGDDGFGVLTILQTPATNLWWPDRGGKQTINVDVPGPVLLEPNTVVQFLPDGSGVGATVFRFYLWLRRTKIIRAQLPTS